MKIEKYIDVGYTPDGKRIRKRIKANSQADFNRQYNALKEYYSLTPSEYLFKDYAKRWLEVYKATREEATITMYRYVLNKTEDIDLMRLSDITSLDCQSLITQNIDHPVVCKRIKLTLNQIFKRAIQDKLMDNNPALNLELPKPVPKEQRMLRKEEKEALKKAKLKDMDKMYVGLLFYLGLRPQEATALMISDFNLDDTVTIRRAIGYKGNQPYIKPTKARNVRIMPIPTVFIPEVKLYLEKLKRQNSLYLIHQNGNPVTKSQRDDIWRRIRTEINLKMGGSKYIDLTDGLIPYTFRHNYCCQCLYSGISLKKCIYLMGHTSPAMVMKVYSHIDNEKEPIEQLKTLAM